MTHDHDPATPGSFRTLFRVVLFGSLAIAAFFLIFEHRAHIFGGKWTAPALLIAFVALHLLMHAGHGRHGGHGSQASNQGESDDER